MSRGFCKDCAYLNITEHEQNQLKGKSYPDHICLKYDVKLHHMVYGVNWHPEIPKCDKCLLTYGYVYSRYVKNSFGEPAVIYNNPGSYIDKNEMHRLAERRAFLPLWL